MTVRLEHVHRKQNLVLGSTLTYLLSSKYDITCPRPDDVLHTYYSNSSFNVMVGSAQKGKRCRFTQAEPDEEDAVEDMYTTEGEEVPLYRGSRRHLVP